MVDKDIVELLDFEAKRINNPDFIDKDPVQFPRRFEKVQDIEIAGLLSAIIAWGNRKMICRDAERMLTLMDNEPYAYVMDEGYEDLNPDMNLHRTFFARHFQYFLRGMRRIYKDYGSLDAFAASVRAGEDSAPAWKLVEEMQKIMSDVNDGATCSQCLPVNLKQTALKRINMALRWFVRDDGIVDMGVWKSIPKSKLYIPLDVHVGNVSRELGLLTRKANDRKSVEELTGVLRELRPDDPCIYDYALFGVGVERAAK
ncbi:MAG: TIGR02757 family protein [Muribaculaceae bacterium]|nr:TIGR02757 family protein [Muribaculaceae bacterium]